MTKIRSMTRRTSQLLAAVGTLSVSLGMNALADSNNAPSGNEDAAHNTQPWGTGQNSIKSVDQNSLKQNGQSSLKWGSQNSFKSSDQNSLKLNGQNSIKWGGSQNTIKLDNQSTVKGNAAGTQNSIKSSTSNGQ